MIYDRSQLPGPIFLVTHRAYDDGQMTCFLANCEWPEGELGRGVVEFILPSGLLFQREIGAPESAVRIVGRFISEFERSGARLDILKLFYWNFDERDVSDHEDSSIVFDAVIWSDNWRQSPLKRKSAAFIKRYESPPLLAGIAVQELYIESSSRRLHLGLRAEDGSKGNVFISLPQKFDISAKEISGFLIANRNQYSDGVVRLVVPELLTAQVFLCAAANNLTDFASRIGSRLAAQVESQPHETNLVANYFYISYYCQNAAEILRYVHDLPDSEATEVGDLSVWRALLRYRHRRLSDERIEKPLDWLADNLLPALQEPPRHTVTLTCALREVETAVSVGSAQSAAATDRIRNWLFGARKWLDHTLGSSDFFEADRLLDPIGSAVQKKTPVEVEIIDLRRGGPAGRPYSDGSTSNAGSSDSQLPLRSGYDLMASNLYCYECVFLARPDLSASQIESLALDYKFLIEEFQGKITKIEACGVKALAYKINGKRHAHYVLLNILAPHAAIAELERQMKITSDVIRVLTVRVETLDSGKSALVRPAEGAPVISKAHRSSWSQLASSRETVLRSDRPSVSPVSKPSASV